MQFYYIFVKEKKKIGFGLRVQQLRHPFIDQVYDDPADHHLPEDVAAIIHGTVDIWAHLRRSVLSKEYNAGYKV